jgi:hypothetical protein
VGKNGLLCLLKSYWVRTTKLFISLYLHEMRESKKGQKRVGGGGCGHFKADSVAWPASHSIYQSAPGKVNCRQTGSNERADNRRRSEPSAWGSVSREGMLATDDGALARWAGEFGVHGLPGLKVETGGTRAWWRIERLDPPDGERFVVSQVRKSGSGAPNSGGQVGATQRRRPVAGNPEGWGGELLTIVRAIPMIPC